MLLDAGASANSRDLKNLTPLYNAICEGNDTKCCEMLLKENCDVDVRDEENNWAELHQVCESRKQPIRTCYSGHVTGHQPIRDQYLLKENCDVDVRDEENNWAELHQVCEI